MLMGVILIYCVKIKMWIVIILGLALWLKHMQIYINCPLGNQYGSIKNISAIETELFFIEDGIKRYF